MGRKRNVWVSPREDGWAIQREGSDRASKVVKTKVEAERLAREVGRRDRVEVVVQRLDGTIQGRESYGSDPFPPRDLEH